MFCKNCGKEIDDRAVVCVNCGAAAGAGLNQENDVPSVGMNILSFFIPIVGIVLYFTTKSQTPIKAKAMLKWSIISIAIYILFYGCTAVMGIIAYM